MVRESVEDDEKFKNIIHAFKFRTEKNKHSDFYTILDTVNSRIHMYKSLFLDR